MSLTVPTKYIKFLVDNNDTVSLFLETTAQQSQKSAQVYGMGLTFCPIFATVRRY
jgi:hypothetical protein